MQEPESVVRACQQLGGQGGAVPAIDAGIFLVDKPAGPSSFRMVQLVRRALGIKKVGHAGTLDPFASGLLIICAARPATRLISQLMDGDKQYEAVLKLGVATTTHDPEGEVTEEKEVGDLDPAQVRASLASFLGEQLQVPPQFSALKHKGKPLYYYARRGIVVEKEARTVTINSLELLELGESTLRIRVDCGKGTYIRTLAADIGRSLGCGAHLLALRRTRSGIFSVADAVDGALLAEREQGRKELMARMLSVSEVNLMLASPG